jgi:hypothetical protein
MESHDVTIYDPPGEHAGNEDYYELECDRCGDVGATYTLQEAKAAATLHRSLGASIVGCFHTPHRAKLTSLESGFDVSCPTCGPIGSADDWDLAALVGRLHEHAFELADVAEEMMSSNS